MINIKDLNNGIKYMLFASLMFAIMGAFAKIASQSMSSIEVVFFRNVFGVLIIGYAVYKKPLKQVGGKPWLLFFRGFMGFSALLAFFYNIAHIPLGEAMTYSKTSPIFTALFAWLFLSERLSLKGWGAIGLGFIGIVFITQPFGIGLSKYDLLGVASGVGAALAYTSVRELKRYYDTRAIVLSFMLVGTVGPALLLMLSSLVAFDIDASYDVVLAPFVMPYGVTWVYLLAMGVTATLAQLYMTKAYGETKAGIVGTVSYSNIIFSIVIGLFLGDSFPSLVTTFGIVLIVVAGLLVARLK